MSDFYDYRRLLSYGATFNFVVGDRGYGKTYGAKRKLIRSYLKRGWQFTYLRRYRTELGTKDTFFDDIAHEFPDYSFRVNGAVFECCEGTPAKGKSWSTMGYAHALSRGLHIKSASFPLVHWSLFDEFIIEKGYVRYLPDEVYAMNNYYSTIDRWQDRVRVIFTANAVSITNPYFLHYNIVPDREIIRFGNGFGIVHFPGSDEFRTRVTDTKFGQFIADTEYADYAVGSKFSDNNTAMIGPKVSEAQYYATITTIRGTFTAWIQWTPLGHHFFIQSKRPRGEENMFTTEQSMMTNDMRYLDRSSRLMQYMRTAFTHGNMWFDTPRTREAFLPIFKR